MKIGENIRKYRLEKDKKQQEIYEAIGVSQSSYSKIENNKRKIDVATLKKIATVLEIDIAKLTGENKIAINNNDNSKIETNIAVHHNHSEELIESLREQIELLKELNQVKKEIINGLKENSTLSKVETEK
ncbi:helix-turn-helix domain-containing protein [Flavobacterium sp. GNP001]